MPQVYLLISLVLSVIIFLVARYWILRNSKLENRRKNTIIVAGLCLLLTILSGHILIDNVKVNFETPEDVLRQYNGRSVDGMVYGNHSVFVYTRAWDSINILIIPRSSDGYKLPSTSTSRIIATNIISGGVFTLFNVEGTTDYYVDGGIRTEYEVKSIVDNNGNAVKFISEWFFESYSTAIFAFVENFTDDYYLIINGERTIHPFQDSIS